MRFNFLSFLCFLICLSTTQLNAQEQEEKAIINGSYRIKYEHGSTYELTIEDSRYSRLSNSGEIQNGDIIIYEDSFILNPDSTDEPTDLNTNEDKSNNSETEKSELIIRNPNEITYLAPCNWYVLNRPNRRTSKFIMYSNGLHIQCGKGRLRKLKND